MRTSTLLTCRGKILAGVIGVLLLALSFTGSAAGKVVNLRVYNGTYPTTGSIDGTGSVGATAPFPNGLLQLGFNQVTNQLLVGNSTLGGRIYKFSATGTPETFGFVAPNTAIESGFLNSFGDINVDNSGGAGGAGEGEQGRIYAFPESSAVRAFKPSGQPFEPAGGNFPISYGQSCGAEVAPNGNLWVASWGSGGITEFDPSTGNAITAGPAGGHISTPGICSLAIDSNENFYAVDENGPVLKYSPSGESLGVFDPYSGAAGEAKEIAVDRSENHVYIVYSEFVREFDSSGSLLTQFGEAEGAYPGLQGAQGVTIDEDNHLVYVANNRGPEPVRVNTFARTGPITIPDVETNDPSVTVTGATLRGQVAPDEANSGSPITGCQFKWGTEATNLNQTAVCDQATPINSPTEVTATVGGLTTGSTYYYQVTATNEAHPLVISSGAIKSFQPAGPPEIKDEAVSDVQTDGATISATVTPSGSVATYWVEFGTTTAYGEILPEPPGETTDNLAPEGISVAIAGLNSGVTYHYRVIAENVGGVTTGSDHTFTTFARPPGIDTCPNAQVRQQTGASLLLDCRSYELVSAANAGGYDVESDIIPGQEPPEAFPRATDRILYSLHRGTIPGIAGNPTNYGNDPYVATRGADGWTSKYVGLPADGMPSNLPFGSPLLGADLNLSTFAFGENGNGTPICDPCFADGSINIPVRRGESPIVKGMAGSLNQAADPAVGATRQPVSGDGTHLVFGTTAKLESDGNSNGDITIYDRNLSTGVTHVVSKTPAGATMTGAGIAELAVSNDGSHVLIGQLVSTDPATGNQYWHLYMNVNDAASSIDLTPSSPGGVLYDGMTSDGSMVYFSAATAGLSESDTSVDLYRAEVGASSSTQSRVSTGTGGTGDTNSCTPVSHWNNAAGADNCDVVAFAGGAGVASGDGTVYFLSPEELDGSGTAGEPNLFVARPGSAPHFVATLDTGNPAIHNAVYNNEVHSYGDFQVTPSGRFAAFATVAPVTEFTTFGHSEIYRFDADADVVGTGLVCASCPPTQAVPITNTFLTPHGLNLSDDGRVFFTSSEPLALRDTNEKADAYEWEDGAVELISTGSSEADSGIVTASADGKNAFFFTRQTLVHQDLNGNAVKIYDARTEGGFPFVAPPDLCKASDECHGPGTQAAPDPVINTVTGPGNVKHPGNLTRPHCRRGFVRKKKRCVRVHHRKHRRHTTRHPG